MQVNAVLYTVLLSTGRGISKINKQKQRWEIILLSKGVDNSLLECVYSLM